MIFSKEDWYKSGNERQNAGKFETCKDKCRMLDLELEHYFDPEAIQIYKRKEDQKRNTVETGENPRAELHTTRVLLEKTFGINRFSG